MPNTIFNFSDLVSGEDCSGARFGPGLKMICSRPKKLLLEYIKLYLATKISKSYLEV